MYIHTPKYRNFLYLDVRVYILNRLTLIKSYQGWGEVTRDRNSD